MSKRKTLLGVGRSIAVAAVLAVASFGVSAPSAFAQDSDEIVVTGSHIRGTPETAALPVDVISAEELAKQGSPTMVEVLRNLPVSTGILGETNQFETRSQAAQGAGSVNLRGLGPQRTLVLLNGRRVTFNPAGGAVDTNTLPLDAIGRIEVLKDGAAATYGSDAIGGVVNFITRTDFEGFEIGGNYRYVDGSDGNDYSGFARWGWQNDRTSVFVSAGYQHRGELRVIDRDFTNAEFATNPQAGWSTAASTAPLYPVFLDNSVDIDPVTPGLQTDADGINDVGIGVSATTGAPTPGLLDPGCASLGGIAVGSAACRYQFLDADNLVELEDRYQIYGQINTEIADGVDLHIEAFYARSEQPEFKTSSGYGGIQFPTSNLTGGNVPTNLPGLGPYFVPINHPALQPGTLLRTAIDNAVATADGLTDGNLVNLQGIALNQLTWRTFSFGGNPRFPSGSGTGTRDYDAYRISGSLSGEVAGINWDVALTYSEETANSTTFDALVGRMQLAMRGFGSLASDPDGCNAAERANPANAGNTAVGCHWFNPFSSSIPANIITGQPNTATYQGASLENSPDLVSWFYQPFTSTATQSLAVFDATFSGETPLTLPGGNVAWALGGQFRRENYNSDLNDTVNAAVTPCVDTEFFGNVGCAVPQGPGHFLGSALERDLTADVYGIFGELQIPIFDNLNVQLAARFEDYGGEVGDTFDPKLSVKWDVTDWLALRGSVGSTFRGPPQTVLTGRLGTSFEFVPNAGRYIAVNNFGNPGLAPESADTFSAGVIFDTGNLKVSVDYWRFDFQNPIVNQTSTQLAAALFADPASCTDAAYADLRANHFVFNGACGAGNLSAINVQFVNGPAIFNDGIDILVDYSFEDVFGGELSLGGAVTYVYDYETEDFTVDGITVAPAFDAAGRLNIGTTAYSLPQLKGTFYADYSWGEEGNHNLRASVTYIDSYVDQRSSGVFSGTPTQLASIFPLTAFPQEGKEIDSFVSLDLDYRAFLPWDTILTVGVDNVFDEDPPFARLNLSYDPGVHNPLGRTFQIGLSKRF